jgi:alpha-beta hydrolase superfamily lysophospholipase
MIKNEFTFLSSDQKTNIHAITCLPKDNKFTRVFQIIHGMCEYIERYLPFIEYLTTKGFAIVGHDQLGHGQSINSEEDLGYVGEPDPNDLLIKDIHILRTITQKKYPDLPYFICGHSMGSYLLRQYICIYSKGLAGIIILGTGYMSPCETLMSLGFLNFLACFKGMRHRSKLTKKISFELGPYKKYDHENKDINNSWISRDPEIVKQYYADKKCQFDFTINGFFGLVTAIIYSCNPSNVAKINKDIPILFVSGDKDPVGNNGEGVKKAYEIMKLIGSVDVTLKLYEGSRHEVLNELNRDEVYEYILNWVNEKTHSK